MRVTKADLIRQIKNLEDITGTALQYSGAYGGHNCIIAATGDNLLWHGHVTARYLSDNLAAYTRGYLAAKADARLHNCG